MIQKHKLLFRCKLSHNTQYWQESTCFLSKLNDEFWINVFFIYSIKYRVHRRASILNWGVAINCNLLLLWKKVCFQLCENTAQRLLGIHSTNEAVSFLLLSIYNFVNLSAKNVLGVAIATHCPLGARWWSRE